MLILYSVPGAPIVASWPHFFDGDVEYQNQSIGLKPNKTLHETSLSLEPVSLYS
jgi:hypothetical protein